MTNLRNLAFQVWLYGLIFLVGFGLSPLLLLPRKMVMAIIRGWAQAVLWGLKVISGVKVEFRGLEHAPQGAALIAGKHMSMLDTIAPFLVLPDACFVLKKELTRMPFFGWYMWRAHMIPIKREDAAKALKSMLVMAKERLSEQRQIIIFPEGTRTEVGEDPVYKPGVAAIYRDLDAPCHLMATNSGQCWPAHGIKRFPGTVVYEFLPPLPAGMKRAEFMGAVRERLETASNALMAENSLNTAARD